MTRTDLPVHSPAGAHTGITVTFIPFDTVNGMSMVNSGRTYIVINNTAATDLQVTAKVPALVDKDLTIEDRQLTITAGAAMVFGPFDPNIYNQPDGTNTLYLDSTAAALIISAFNG